MSISKTFMALLRNHTGIVSSMSGASDEEVT